MKRSVSSVFELLAVIVAFVAVSCQKVDVTSVDDAISQEQETVLESNVVDVHEYSAQEFADLFEWIEAPAATRCAAISYEVARMTYQSVSGTGEEITLSMKIAYPKGILTKYQDPDFIVLDNHPTYLSDAEVPWNCNPIALAKALDDALVVCPDYEGYGISSHRDHPYLAHDLNARQSVDAVLAAIDYINSKKGIKMSKGYYLENYGYSQGAGIALAVHKYIENSLPAQDREKINLRLTYCGGGPYDPELTMRKYFEQDAISYPAIIPATLIGNMSAYPEYFKGIRLEDFFSDAFLATGTIDRIRSKQYTIDEVNEYINKALGSNKCSDILRPEAFDPADPLNIAFSRSLSRSCVARGWTPVARVNIMHSREDQIVPMENALSAYEGLSDGNVSEIEWAFLSPEHRIAGALFYIKYMKLHMITGVIDHLLNLG